MRRGSHAWSFAVLVGALALGSGCVGDSLAEDGWPCSATRPCAEGWTCGQSLVCVKGHGPKVPPTSDTSAPPSPAPDTGTDGEPETVCLPDCPPGVCGDDGCGGSCGPCTLPIKTTLPSPDHEPRGLAVSEHGVFVGDVTDHLVRLLDPDSHDVVEEIPLPTSAGAPVDLVVHPKTGRLLALLGSSPAQLWSVWPDAEASVLAELPGATALDFYGATVLTVEGNQLVRRDPDTLAALEKTPLDDACSMLAVRAGIGYRACSVSGAPGSYVQHLQSYDVVSKNTTPALEPLAVALDASVLAGLAVDKDGLWLLGRGYGGHNAHIAFVELK